ncbi:MAG: lysine--tRNA ligase [bacterium]
MSKKENIEEQINLEEISSNENVVRLEKVNELQKMGINPWPEFKPVNATTVQVLDEFDPEKEKKYEIAGRLITIREHGKTVFAHIQDRAGRLQIYLRKDALGDEKFDFFLKYLDVGDIIWVKGESFKTQKGEITLRVSDFTLLSKCLHPLPEKFHGLSDVEARYRQRYLDLISNPESLEKFKKRSEIIQSIRQFLLDRDFLEVETPMLHPIPGGAVARPFVTHHNAYDMDLYLRIAPELYLKRLVIGGIEKVFEINRNFRNEGISTRHNPEFTMLEFYMAHGNYKDGIKLTEELIQDAVKHSCGKLTVEFQGKDLDFTAPFKQLTVEQALVEIGGFNKEQFDQENINKLLKDLNVEIPKGQDYHGAKLFALFEEKVEGKIFQPTFIVGYPIEISPLAKRDPNNPNIAARFELFAASMEIANGFTELNDPIDQAQRFKSQAEAKENGDEEAHHYDADFIKALEYGLPPTVGVGVGIDRLVMLATDTTSIKDVILFPTLKKVG